VIDILIPVLRRPRNVTPLLESLEVTKSEHRIFFICTRGDHEQIAAVEEAGYEPLIHPEKAGVGNFARKINWAFDQTDAEWVFQGADDLRFRRGWDTAALATAMKRKASVIGTNDMHNPGVRKGLHSTHTLIRRSYIEEHGGTFDDSGRIFHEGYDHQYVDNEFIETAKMRGVWAFARNSIVEHLHPHWGNADMDWTYRKATRQSMADRRLYFERMSVMLGNRRRGRYSSRRR
jgi:hypothetical protein